MINNPYDYQHPLFQNQKDYTLQRVILDTGDEEHEAIATLTFSHNESQQIRSFRFRNIGLTVYCSSIVNIRGYLPFYVATLEGRGFGKGINIEVGDTDPGGEWFWAESIEEIINT